MDSFPIPSRLRRSKIQLETHTKPPAAQAKICEILRINSRLRIFVLKICKYNTIARSEIQTGTGNEFLNFNLIKK